MIAVVLFTFNVATPVTANMRTNMVVNTSSPLQDGQQLLNQIAAAIDKPTELAKLIDGSMNTTVGKQFLEALTATQSYFNANRTTLKTDAKTQIMTFYAQLTVGMINYIGMLKSDIKASEGLAKNFTAAGDGIKAMVALGMALQQKNDIKNRLTALSQLNKPVAAALASNMKGAL